MNSESFELFVGILMIIKNNECIDVKNVIEIIDEYKEMLSGDQKTEVFNILLDYSKKKDPNQVLYNNVSNEMMINDSGYF